MKHNVSCSTSFYLMFRFYVLLFILKMAKPFREKFY